MTPRPRVLKVLDSGLPQLDSLAVQEDPTLQAYIDAVSQYVLNQRSMAKSTAKRAQIALSAGLGRALRNQLKVRLPRMNPTAGEVNVAGALRTVRADVSESHPLDGLRLAVEIKPVNVAVGRAMWNRFGDIRTFAVNIHLKFPFAVVGGVLTVPSFEWKEPAASLATPLDAIQLDGPDEAEEVEKIAVTASEGRVLTKATTLPLIQRAVKRFERARRREIEADPPHLLEAVAVVVYDPDTSRILPELPPPESGMRWDEFVQLLADAYDVRFE